MKYDFDTLCDRKNTSCVKWDDVKSVFGSADVLPMWVADMDFPAAQPIIDALKARVEHGFYGYTHAGPSMIEAIVDRMQRKFNWKIKPEWVVITPGVIPALSVAVRSITRPGDGVIVQEPVYFPFFNVVTSSGCQIVNNGLKLVDGRYEMDYEDLQRKFHAQPGMRPIASRVKAIMLCNPHNPVGRHWNNEELTRMGDIVLRHGGIVISDEIHCEILFDGNRHTPFAMISEDFEQNCVVCMAPSKTFNLAGLGISSTIIPNKKLRDTFNETKARLLPGQNLFGLTAMEAAYRHGDEWLEQLLVYLQGNVDTTMDYFEKHIPRIKATRPQGTYLVWLDCRGLGLDKLALTKFMREKAKVGMNDGFLFGEASAGFQRMNIACPRSMLLEALQRIETAVNSISG